MNLAVSQPNFFPWLGYFELLDIVDIFVFLDDAEYTYGSFISRNKVVSPNGNPKWLSLSLKKSKSNEIINEKIVLIKENYHLLNVVEAYYKKAPFYKEIHKILKDLLVFNVKNNLSGLNINIIKTIVDLIGIEVNYGISSDFTHCEHLKSVEKVLCILREFDCKAYYNFSKGIEIGIHPPNIYTEQKIKLYKQEYKHPTYIHPNFYSHMSILDLIFYELPNALEIIRSGRKWILMNEELS